MSIAEDFFHTNGVNMSAIQARVISQAGEKGDIVTDIEGSTASAVLYVCPTPGDRGVVGVEVVLQADALHGVVCTVSPKSPQIRVDVKDPTG